MAPLGLTRHPTNMKDASRTALNDALTRTQDVYERHASSWDKQRRSLPFAEKGWLDRFTAALPPRARILELGPGAGLPISDYLIHCGYHLTGIDASRSMLTIARQRFPSATWLRGDMRDLNLPEQFDGIIAWDSFFHLPQADQIRLLPKLSAHLKSDGALLVTVGPKAGEVLGSIGGDAVYHASLAPEDYRQRLESLGFTSIHFQAEDPDCQQRSVILAVRERRQSPPNQMTS